MNRYNISIEDTKGQCLVSDHLDRHSSVKHLMGCLEIALPKQILDSVAEALPLVVDSLAQPKPTPI